MKPLKLKLQAFGSFPGSVEVDFDSLAPRGVFVVSGDTGTGKTTIFDAMCWGLYGEMPLKDTGHVRSDHASVDTETLVELTFECDGVRYVVERKPTQERPAKRGSGTATEPASASLVRIGSDGSELLSSKTKETSARCVELVGLDATQFQRVVLLPQGEFARFLLAGTGDREQLLGKLFGARVFDDMVDYLKDHRYTLRSRLQTADADIKAQLDNARESLARVHDALGIEVPESLGHTDPPHPDATEDPEPVTLADRDELGSIRATVVEPLEQATTKVQELKRRADAAANTHSTAEQAAQRFDYALLHLHQIKCLDAEQGDVMAAEAAALLSRSARPVVAESDALVKARALQAANTSTRDERVTRIMGDLGALGATPDPSSAAAITKAYEEHRQTNQEQDSKLRAELAAAKEHQGATAAHADACTKLEAAQERKSTAEALVTRIEKSDLPPLREQQVDPAELRSRIDATTRSVELCTKLDAALADHKQAEEADQAAAAEHRRVFESFLASQAPLLAQRLIDGEPCPVCGSDVHPAPAPGDEESTTSSADLELAAEARQEAGDALGKATTKVEKLRVELGDDAERSTEELEARRAELDKELANATELNERIAALEEKLVDTREEVHTAEKQIAALEQAKNNTEEKLRTAKEALAETTKAAEGIDADTVQADAAVLATLGDQMASLEDLFISVAQADSSVEDCIRRLADALEASDFETAEAAQAALLDQHEETTRIDRAKAHRDKRTASEAALVTLSEQEVPEQRPDLEQTRIAKETAQLEHGKHAAALQTATDNAGYCDTALGNHDELVSGSEDLRAQHDFAQRAHSVCNNGGALAMSLKRWVLTRELDRVTAAANVHLVRMTAHRYSLRRKVDTGDKRRSFGLDLEVLDSTTGRPRSTSTLSGGEQFQASLALALGLADVVSHGGSASGKRFEALFVDEGFGSLDSQSLDDAIEALHQLHASGRMVGAITHVDAMKQQLHVGIEVRHLPDGAGSTLVVNP